jgi:hypothetical protein
MVEKSWFPPTNHDTQSKMENSSKFDKPQENGIPRTKTKIHKKLLDNSKTDPKKIGQKSRPNVSSTLQKGETESNRLSNSWKGSSRLEPKGKTLNDASAFEPIYPPGGKGPGDPNLHPNTAKDNVRMLKTGLVICGGIIMLLIILPASLYYIRRKRKQEMKSKRSKNGSNHNNGSNGENVNTTAYRHPNVYSRIPHQNGPHWGGYNPHYQHHQLDANVQQYHDIYPPHHLTHHGNALSPPPQNAPSGSHPNQSLSPNHISQQYSNENSLETANFENQYNHHPGQNPAQITNPGQNQFNYNYEYHNLHGNMFLPNMGNHPDFYPGHSYQITPEQYQQMLHQQHMATANGYDYGYPQSECQSEVGFDPVLRYVETLGEDLRTPKNKKIRTNGTGTPHPIITRQLSQKSLAKSDMSWTDEESKVDEAHTMTTDSKSTSASLPAHLPSTQTSKYDSNSNKSPQLSQTNDSAYGSRGSIQSPNRTSFRYEPSMVCEVGDGQIDSLSGAPPCVQYKNTELPYLPPDGQPKPSQSEHSTIATVVENVAHFRQNSFQNSPQPSTC